MTKRAKNTPIGTVECPHKGCTKSCQVYQFRPRTEGRTSVFSGKYYAECPDHGRVGSDGNPATSRYIQEHYAVSGAAPETPVKNPAPAGPAPTKPVRTTSAPKPAIVPSPPGSTGRPWWRPLID